MQINNWSGLLNSKRLSKTPRDINNDLVIIGTNTAGGFKKQDTWQPYTMTLADLATAIGGGGGGGGVNFKLQSLSTYIELTLNTVAQSYTPGYGNYLGMLIRHEENVTIGDRLSTFKMVKGKQIKTYAPSVYYVYKPSNDTMGSVNELRDKNYKYQDNYRLLTEDVIDGRDELGLSIFLMNEGLKKKSVEKRRLLHYKCI
jgi:hypothetical protein